MGHERQRGSARGQMQEFATWKFHGADSLAFSRKESTSEYGKEATAVRHFDLADVRLGGIRVDRALDESPLVPLFQTCQAAVGFVATYHKRPFDRLAQ
jgi:hypothetical protein